MPTAPTRPTDSTTGEASGIIKALSMLMWTYRKREFLHGEKWGRNERTEPCELVQDHSECPGKMYGMRRRDRSGAVVMVLCRGARLLCWDRWAL